MTEPTDRRCIVHEGHATANHGHLCGGHFQRLAEMLRQIEEEAIALSAVPSMQQSTGNRSSGLASERANSRLNVIAMQDPRTVAYQPRLPGPACHRCWHDTCQLIRNWVDAYDSQATDLASIVGTLHGWARIVRHERALAQPPHITVIGERDTLTRQLDWIAAQPWADEMYEGVRHLLEQLRTANGHRPPKPIGRCVLDAGDRLCGGNVWEQEITYIAETVSGHSLITAPDGPAVCDRCGASWPTPEDKARLRLMIEQVHRERAEARAEADRPRTEDGRPMLTAAELMQQHGMSRAAFDVRAHRLRKAGRGGISYGGYYDPAGFDRATA